MWTSKSVRLEWKEALYLYLLYIYVISSRYKEVIIKLVECYVRASVCWLLCFCVLQKENIYHFLSLSLLKSVVLVVLYFA